MKQKIMNQIRMIKNKFGRVVRNVLDSSLVIGHSSFRGSALIFTLLIVGLVASLSFFVGRSAVREVRIVSADQNSLGAYYVAEAGLEDGLARLAADPNIEVPTCYLSQPHMADGTKPCDSSDIGPYATNGFNKDLSVADIALATPLSFPSRTRVALYPANSSGAQTSNNSTACLPQPACKNTNINNLNLAPYVAGTTNPDPPTSGDYVYDLKITSRIKNFGPVNAGGDPVDPCVPICSSAAFIPKDSYREFTLYTSGPDQPDELDYWWTCQTAPCNYSKILDFSITRPNPTSGYDPVEEQVKYGNLASGGLNNIVFQPVTTGAVSKVRIKALVDGAYVSVAFKNNTVPVHYVFFKGDIARLQSVGYHAGIKRRLEADVDRRSGGLLGLFDYAVYAGTTFTQPL